MPLTEKQQAYLAGCSHRWNVKTGATGSGKSFVDFAVTIPKRIQAARGEGLLVLLGDTRGTLERNILDPMRDIWPGLVGNIRSNNTVMLFGKKVYALGADNKKHVSRIQGASFEYVYGDEVTTWSEDVFQMLKSRLRCEHSHFDGTCNPEGPNHWFKKFLDSDADIFQQSYVIDDGILPARTVAELKKEYAGTVYYDRWILGKWRQAEGLVYPMFDYNKHTTNETAPISPRHRYHVSVDFGVNNPFAAGLYDFDPITKQAVKIKELYYKGGSAGRVDNEKYYQMLQALIGDYPLEYLVIDPSASSMIETVHSHGEYLVVGANNEVIDGIQDMTRFLNTGALRIHRRCKKTLEEIQLYSWDDKKQEDVVIKENDHCMDETRYYCRTVLKNEVAG